MEIEQSVKEVPANFTFAGIFSVFGKSNDVW